MSRLAGGPAARVVATVITANTLAVLPVFLVGGLATLLRADLAFTEAGLGAAVAVFFAASAVASVPGGRLGERVGAGRALTLGVGVGGAALLGVALVARSWAALAVCLTLAGVGNGIIQPSTNLALARGIARRQGLAFGLKQASVPAATLIAGVAVPAVGLTVGWRWAFAGGAAVAAGFILAARGLSATPAGGAPEPAGRDRPATGPLVLLALAAALAASAANSMGAFLVDSAVTAGMAVGSAGLLLAFGSAVGIAARVGVGWQADSRDGGHLPVVAALIAVGALGFVALGVAGSDALLVVGTALGFGAGWGWTGLFNLAVVRRSAAAPAAATGITQTGVFVGGVVGPLAFGALVARAGYPTAWFAAAAAATAAAGLMLVGRAALARALATRGLQ